MPRPVRSSISVPFFHYNVIRGNPELFCDDLRVSSLVPLSLRFGTEPSDDLSRGMNPDFCTVEHFQSEDIKVVRRSSSDDLSKAADADPHELALLALLFLLLSQVIVANPVHGLL